MAIAFKGHATGSTTNGSNITLNLAAPASGSAPSAGDVVLVVSCSFNRSGNEGRIGNALSYAETNSFAGATRRHRVAWKAWASGENSVVVEGTANAADGMAAVAVWFSGVEVTSSPFSVANTIAGGTSTNPDPALIVPVNDNCAVVVLAGSGSNDAAPGTITNYTVLSGVAGNDTNPNSAAVAYRILSGGSGVAENPAAFSAWVTGGWYVVTSALRELFPICTGTLAITEANDAISAAGTAYTPDAWNAGDKSASITLSNSDKTATTVSAVVGIRSSTAHLNETAGKYYAEFLLTNVTAGVLYVGINNLTGSLTSSTGASFHVKTSDGSVSINNVSFGTITDGVPLFDGDVISVAWDSGAQRVCFRVNNGDWNGNAGLVPGGAVGYNCSFAAAVNHALWFATISDARVVTLRTEAAEFTQAAPSGFASWMGEAILTNITGTLSVTEAADTISAAGTVEGDVGPITGTLNVTETADTIAAAGTANFPDAWNAGDKSANMVLSNSGKTATLSSAVTGGVRSTTKYLNGTETQKFYVEFAITNAISGFSCQVGLREIGVALNTSAGSTFQCATNSGNIVVGSATTVGNTGGAPLLDGDTVCLAWSPSTERGWFRKNSGLWNNDAAANPATNTNGLDISALNNTDHALLFLAASSLNGAIVTVRTEAAELVYAAPSGFVSWMGESLAGSITGTLNITEADDAISALATVTVTGTLSVTEANDTLAATGTVEAVAAVTGALNITEANDTLAALATITIGGALNVAESNDTLSSAGTVSDHSVVTGSLNVTEADDTISATATVTGEVVVPPVVSGGGYYAPPRPYPVEGFGYGILPPILGEARGVVSVGSDGVGLGLLPRFAGEATAAIGAAGLSRAQLEIRAAARGQAGAQARGFGMIMKLEGAAVGRQADDDAVAVTFLMAA